MRTELTDSWAAQRTRKAETELRQGGGAFAGDGERAVLAREHLKTVILAAGPRQREAFERLLGNGQVELTNSLARVRRRLSQGVDLVLWPASRGNELVSECQAAGLTVSYLYQPRSPAGATLYLGQARIGSHKEANRFLADTGHWWEVRESETVLHERYRKLLNRLSDGYLEVDAQDTIRWANAAFRRAVGQETVEGTPLEQALDPDDARRLRTLRQQHHQGVVITFPLRLCNGLTVEVDPSPRFDSVGTYLGASLVLRGLQGHTSDLERGRDLFTLYSVASVLTEANKLYDALQAVVLRILELMGLSGGGVFLAGPGGLELRVLAGLGLDRVALAALAELAAGVSQKARVLRELQPDEPIGLTLGRAGLKSVALIPLVHSGEQIGVLWVVARESRRLTREVVSLLISIAAQTATSVVNHRHVEARLEEEANRRKFYRNALQAVTKGKLIVCERPEADATWRSAGEDAGEVVVDTTADVPRARDLVEAVLKAEGFAEDRCYDLALCTCEAAANVIKHADGGRVSIRQGPDAAFVRIEDQGPGIDFAHLPDAVLTPGFSTAPSLGMGYSMLLELADRVHLSTGEGGTCLLLEVSRQQADPLDAFSALLEGL